MKEEICRAFCGDLKVRKVPDGFAVSTTFQKGDGDAIAFYIVPAGPGLWRIEDDGLTMPLLMEQGVDFATETRARALTELLSEYGAVYDADVGSVHTEALTEAHLPRAAMKFVALLLRMGDFLLLSTEKVASTFKEDAAERVRQALRGRADIAEGEPVSPALAEVTPDMVLRAPGRPPVALFFGNSSQKVSDAIFLQMAAHYESAEDLQVIALLETEGIVSAELRRRAANRLSSVPVFRRDENAAIAQITRATLGQSSARVQ